MNCPFTGGSLRKSSIATTDRPANGKSIIENISANLASMLVHKPLRNLEKQLITWL